MGQTIHDYAAYGDPDYPEPTRLLSHDPSPFSPHMLGQNFLDIQAHLPSYSAYIKANSSINTNSYQRNPQPNHQAGVGIDQVRCTFSGDNLGRNVAGLVKRLWEKQHRANDIRWV